MLDFFRRSEVRAIPDLPEFLVDRATKPQKNLGKPQRQGVWFQANPEETGDASQEVQNADLLWEQVVLG